MNTIKAELINSLNSKDFVEFSNLILDKQILDIIEKELKEEEVNTLLNFKKTKNSKHYELLSSYILNTN